MREVGKEVYRKGGMQERRDAGLREVGQEVYTVQERRDAGRRDTG